MHKKHQNTIQSFGYNIPDQCSLGNARISPAGEEQVNSTNGCVINSIKIYINLSHCTVNKSRKRSEKTVRQYFPKEIKFGYAKFGDTLNCPMHHYTSLHYIQLQACEAPRCLKYAETSTKNDRQYGFLNEEKLLAERSIYLFHFFLYLFDSFMFILYFFVGVWFWLILGLSLCFILFHSVSFCASFLPLFITLSHSFQVTVSSMLENRKAGKLDDLQVPQSQHTPRPPEQRNTSESIET